MGPDSRNIPSLIDRLDHPDAGIQDEILQQLSRRSEEARPVVLANLPLVNARVRRAILRWLNDQLHPEATLPLMRYVFDERDTVAEQMGRSMAMGLLVRRAKTTDQPDEQGRLRAFGEDMCADDNPDVRRLAARILAYTGDERSLEQLEPLLEDDDQDVRQAATKTAGVLRQAADQAEPDERVEPPARLRRRLLNSAGPLRRQLIRKWRRHPERADIAVEILERGGELQQQALQILLSRPDEAARKFLVPLVEENPDSDLAALSLRLLAKIAGDDPSPAEQQAVRRGLESSSVFTRAAACRAAGALQMTSLTERLLDLTESRHITVALDAAKALGKLLASRDHELLGRMVRSLKTNERRRRRHRDEKDWVTLVAQLLSSIRKVVSPTTIGVRALQRAVLDILADGGDKKPLRVTGIQVLLASTPQQGLERLHRWDSADASALLHLIRGAEPAAARRIAELLRRGAPEGMVGLDEAARLLWDGNAVSVTDAVVPILDLAGTDQALRWLQQIADSGEEPAATAAQRRLRKRRGDDVIDVEFIPRDNGN